MSRSVKRLIIIATYLAIVGGLVFVVWSAGREVASCSDGKKNQNEKNVDCGGVCSACEQRLVGEEFEIRSVHLLQGAENKYDVLVEIRNPNALYGASSVPYSISLTDADGLQIESVRGETFVLPNQDRSIIEIGIPAATTPSGAQVEIDLEGTVWVKFADFADPDFIVDGKRFGTIESGSSDYAEAFGSIHNRTTFDFQRVHVGVIIREPDGDPIAVNKTIVDDFVGFTQRDFRLPWQYQFPGNLSRMDVEVAVNVFDAQNFIKQFTPETQVIDQR
jgi:hypothetical protein